MSAEILREAARLMRDRARAAMRDLPEQPWKAAPTIDPDNHGWVVASDIPEADWDTTVATLPYDYEGDAAPHIASWHPVAALAVADVLDALADAHVHIAGREVAVCGMPGMADSPAMVLARAYLGEQVTP